jgi:hypothetical protein
MGTRGTCGYRLNKEDHLWYNPYDSYPEYLGVKMLKIARGVEPMGEALPLYEGQNEDNNWINHGHCEWGYIIDVDVSEFQVYKSNAPRDAEVADGLHDYGYGCKLVAVWPIGSVPDDWIFHVRERLDLLPEDFRRR